jgi:hypothetical protein
MEKSIGFLEGVSGHTYDTIYDLLFTTERVIALIVQHPADVSYKLGFTELFLGGQSAGRRERFDRKKSAVERLRAYQEKTFDELLASHRFNIEIPHDIITAVEITRGWLHRRLKFHIDSPMNKRRTIQFNLAEVQIPDGQNLLNSALPLKIKEK